MCKLPKFSDPRLLVGVETSDDAAVYVMNENQAVIQTLDFFTPVVDDPYTYGQIAAANALSDVYAMGGVPTLALNIVCFPKQLDIEILGEILRGGADKVMEAGALLVGGHSIQDDEPKYGLSVMGTVHPQKVLKNVGAKVGDLLILTKPIGTGVLNTCVGEDLLSKTEYEGLIQSMTTLNKEAAMPLSQFSVSACTDITGFGLLGHLAEMLSEGNLCCELYFEDVPLLEGAITYANMGIIPGGTYSNSAHIGKRVQFDETLPQYAMDLLYDPQTSGGLLISINEAEGNELLEIYQNTLKLPFAVIGRVKEKNGVDAPLIDVKPRR